MNCDTRSATCQSTCSVSNSPALTFAAPTSATAGTRPDAGGNLAQAGVGIELNYYAFAFLDDNVLLGNPKRVSVFDNSRVARERDELAGM